MRERYLRAVGRLLPRKVRRAVLRDLEEQFDAAAEHGESEEGVIARLGAPEEFAAPFREERRPALWPPLVLAGLGLLVSAACGLGLWLQARLGGENVGVIGGADGLTLSGDLAGEGRCTSQVVDDQTLRLEVSMEDGSAFTGVCGVRDYDSGGSTPVLLLSNADYILSFLPAQPGGARPGHIPDRPGIEIL